MKSILLKLILFILTSSPVLALDTVKIALNDREVSLYKTELLQSALEHTQKEYGPYELIVHDVEVTSLRFMREFDSGLLFNTSIQLTTPEREAQSIAVKIPIDKGLLNYRLLLVNQDQVQKFSHIKDLNDLKKFNVGLLSDWVTARIVHSHHFNSIDIPSYEGLFRLLAANKYDYTIRGVNEIYSEIDIYSPQNNNLTVLPGIALYINSPAYVFVSKNYPRLAQRIERGFELMHQDGSFDLILMKWFKKYLDTAQLDQRLVIHIDNPFLPEGTPIENKAYWYSIAKD